MLVENSEWHRIMIKDEREEAEKFRDAVYKLFSAINDENPRFDAIKNEMNILKTLNLNHKMLPGDVPKSWGKFCESFEGCDARNEANNPEVQARARQCTVAAKNNARPRFGKCDGPGSNLASQRYMRL